MEKDNLAKNQEQQAKYYNDSARDPFDSLQKVMLFRMKPFW